MMTLYTMDDIIRLQMDDAFRESEGDKYCLINLIGQELSKQDLNNQANFCILQTINAYKENKIDKNNANRIINKVEAFVYSEDMLGITRVIEKLNKEIVEEELHIPHFHSLCVLCGELYDAF